ncbi:hypothetical protein M758_12G022900 [Ceratodon purpureus]|nr:hypothetical protein M758_12G022900 [Ceratodon purpureus]
MNESALRLARKASPSMPLLVVETSMSDGKSLSSNGRGSGCKVPCVHRKVKSAIWLCSGILFCTVVLFVLVSLDPSKVSEDPRLLVTFPYRIRNHLVLERGSDRSKLGYDSDAMDEAQEEVLGLPALEGMGMLFRKGTRAMPELVVAHLSETTTPDDLRLFLRGLHRSGMPARADVVLLFPWRPLPLEFAAVIRHEDHSFRRLLAKFRKTHQGGDLGKLSVFNPSAYSRMMSISDYGKRQESIWGKVNHVGNASVSNGDDNAGNEGRVHYGAIVGFDMQELDPDDALSGFLDSPPATLRRWVCYQILIGMVRHRYRHILLTEVTGVVILKDVLSSLKKKDTSLHLYYTGQRWSDSESGSNGNATTGIPIVESVYGKTFWNSLEDEDKTRKMISTSVMVGGIRQVRSVTTAMATEIVRVALLHQDRVAFRVDSPILSFLVHKSSSLGKKVASHLQVHESGASIVNLLPGPPRSAPFDDFFRKSDSRFSILQGLQNGGVSQDRRTKILESLRKDFCGSAQTGVEVYSDCYLQPLAGHTDSTKTVS